MKKLLALLLVLLLALPSGFALAEETPEDNEDASGFWSNIGAQLNDLWGSAQEKAENAAKTISDKASELGDLWDSAQEKAKNAANAISEKASELAGQVPDALQGLTDKAKEAWEKGKERLSDLIDLAEVAGPIIWENIKDTAANAADSVKQFVRGKLQQLLSWIQEDENADDQSQTVPRVLYFDAFYFGMPLSEAKLQGIGADMGNPVIDEANGVQYWTVRFEGSQDTAILVFDGLDENAELSQIICTVIDGKGAVSVTEATASSQETIDAVYNSISSWFSGDLEISLGDQLLLPIYPGALSGGSTLSRVRMFLFADGKGYDAATHFVLTGENSAVNMVQYQYLDAKILEALLAE